MTKDVYSKIMGRSVDLMFNDGLTDECATALSPQVINEVNLFKYEKVSDIRQPMLYYATKKLYYFYSFEDILEFNLVVWGHLPT